MQYLALLVIVLSSLSSYAGKISVLQGVSTSFEEDAFVTELTFNQKIGVEDVLVEYINQTIQLNIPGATISTGKQLNRVNKEGVKSVYTYQFQPDIMRLRVIHEKEVDADGFKGRVKVDSLGKKIRVVILKSELAKTAEKAIKEVELIPPVSLDSDLKKTFASAQPKMSALDVVSKELDIPTKLPEKKIVLAPKAKPSGEKGSKYKKADDDRSNTKNDDQENSKAMLAAIDEKEGKSGGRKPLILSAKSEKNSPIFTGAKSKKEKIGPSYSRMIISMLIIAAFAAGLLVFTKWWSRNHSPNRDDTKIRVLTSHHLGPKKSLTIVRVAGEHLLLGVTDHNISILKTLSLIDDEFEEDTPTSFNSALVESNEETKRPLPQQKMTFAPQGADPLNEIKSQVRDKLNSMRNI